MTFLQSVVSRLNKFSPISNYRCQFLNRISTSAVYNYTPKQTVEEKIGIKPKPKKPLTPFLRYLSEHRGNVKQRNPQASMPDVVRIIAEMWKKADSSVKAPLEEIYQKDRAKYLEQCKEYDKLLTPVTRAEIAKVKEEIKTEKEKKAIKKEKEKLGCPKKPGSSYVYFMREKLSDRGSTPFLEFQKTLKKEWGLLSESDKRRYEDMYERDLNNYRSKLILWTKDMEEKGYLVETPRLPKKRKHKDAPKRPPPAFNFFLKSRLSDRGDLSYMEFQKILAKEWEQMPPEERKEFDDKYNQALKEYKEELAAWGKSRESKAKAGEGSGECPPLVDSSLETRLATSPPRLTQVSNDSNLDMSPFDSTTRPENEKILKPSETHPSADSNNKKIIMFSIFISTTVVFLYTIYVLMFY